MSKTGGNPPHMAVRWIAKLVLAVGLCCLVLGRAHLNDKLEVRDAKGKVQEYWGRLIGRTDSGDWRWQDRGGAQQQISDSQVVRRTNAVGREEPAFELGLTSLAKAAYRSGWVWLGVGLIPLEVFLGAWRWQRLLQAGRIKLAYGKVLMLTVVGNFFNHALPTFTGGDVIRAYYVIQAHPKRKSQAVVSLIADRMAGFAGLAIVCLGAVATGWNDPLVQKIRWPILLVVGVLAVMGAILLVPGLAGLLRVRWFVDKLPFQGIVGQVRRAVRLYSIQPGICILAVGISVGVHLILLTCVYLGGRALVPGPGYHHYLVLLPPTWMISAVAVTPGAVAWMEMWYQQILGQAGVSGTAALSLSLFHRFALLVWALPGVVFYIKGMGFKAAVRDRRMDMARLEQMAEDNEQQDGDRENGPRADSDQGLAGI